MSIFKKMGKELGKQRSVDISLEKILSSMKYDYQIVPSKEIKAWKAYLVIAFVGGFAAAIIWSVYMNIYAPSEASEPAQVTLYSSADATNHKNGESFPLQIMLNTAGRNIVAVQAVINYDKSKLELVSVDISSSAFVYEVKNFIDQSMGQGFISLAKPTPGVNNSAARVAIANFRALADVNEPVVTFKFDTLEAVSDSAAILDDGLGTNVLQRLAYLYPNAVPVPSDFRIYSVVALSDTAVKLDWTAGSLENKKYLIERRTNRSSFETVGETEYSVRTYTDLGLKARTAYLWRVCQQSDNGEKICTGETALRTLKKNTILKPTFSVSNENGKVRLNWSPAFAAPFDVNVQRKLSNQKKFTNIKTIEPGSNTYLDESVGAGKKYTYRLMISLKGKKTRYSNNKKITTPPEIQTAPQTIQNVAPQTVSEPPPATVPENSAEPVLQNGTEAPAQ